MGEQPEWYPLVRAAKYLGVPPWELARQPLYWTEVALAAMDAERRARAHAEKRKHSAR
jgi:hypothetical protein